jgi:hypothetical protein
MTGDDQGPNSTTVEVRPSPDGGWDVVVRDGTSGMETIAATFETEAEALKCIGSLDNASSGVEWDDFPR